MPGLVSRSRVCDSPYTAPAGGDPGRKLGDLVDDVRRTRGVQHLIEKVLAGGLVFKVGGGPFGLPLGLPKRFFLPGRDALAEHRQPRRVVRAKGKRPRRHQRLVEHDFVGRVGCRRALDVAAQRRVQPHPAGERGLPLVGDLAQHRQAHPRILAALVVVRGGGEQGARENAGAARRWRRGTPRARARTATAPSPPRCGRAAGRSGKRRCPRPTWRRSATRAAGSAPWPADAPAAAGRRGSLRTSVPLSQPPMSSSSGRSAARTVRRAPSIAQASTVASASEMPPIPA